MHLISDFILARQVAVGTFILNVLCQAYHLTEPPPLYVAFYPNPLFVVILLFAEVLLHAAWLTDLWQREPPEKLTGCHPMLEPPVLSPDTPKTRPVGIRSHSFDYEAVRAKAQKVLASEASAKRVHRAQMDYLQVYILSNLCLGISNIFSFLCHNS